MMRDSLSNDTHNATNQTKTQPRSAVVPPTAGCGFSDLSMIGYATPGNRDYGAVSSGNQQQGAVLGGGV